MMTNDVAEGIDAFFEKRQAGVDRAVSKRLLTGNNPVK